MRFTNDRRHVRNVGSVRARARFDKGLVTFRLRAAFSTYLVRRCCRRNVRDTLQAAVAAGELPDLPADMLASMLIGALDEAALLIASADDPTAARGAAGAVVNALLAGLFRDPTHQ
jgi:AcrR family transcriptional regulator